MLAHIINILQLRGMLQLTHCLAPCSGFGQTDLSNFVQRLGCLTSTCAAAGALAAKTNKFYRDLLRIVPYLTLGDHQAEGTSACAEREIFHVLKGNVCSSVGKLLHVLKGNFSTC